MYFRFDGEARADGAAQSGQHVWGKRAAPPPRAASRLGSGPRQLPARLPTPRLLRDTLDKQYYKPDTICPLLYRYIYTI